MDIVIADKFQVVKGSMSGHCCFEATVVDMTRPLMINGKHYKDQYESLCECLDVGDAEAIASALNQRQDR